MLESVPVVELDGVCVASDVVVSVKGVVPETHLQGHSSRAASVLQSARWQKNKSEQGGAVDVEVVPV